jgi:hypothetical protein
LFLNQFVVFFNHSTIPFQKFSNGFRLQRSIALKKYVTWLIFYDEDELIQILIPSLDCLKLMMTPTIQNIHSKMNKEKDMGKPHNIFAQQTKWFSISIHCINNCPYICNSFSRWT